MIAANIKSDSLRSALAILKSKGIAKSPLVITAVAPYEGEDAKFSLSFFIYGRLTVADIAGATVSSSGEAAIDFSKMERSLKNFSGSVKLRENDGSIELSALENIEEDSIEKKPFPAMLVIKDTDITSC